jgi:hypothetical protein
VSSGVKGSLAVFPGVGYGSKVFPVIVSWKLAAGQIVHFQCSMDVNSGVKCSPKLFLKRLAKKSFLLSWGMEQDFSRRREMEQSVSLN